jgi:YfiH family protein
MSETTPPVSGLAREASSATPPGVGFSWHDTVAGRVLQATDLAAIAPHVFTSRDLTFQGTRFEQDLARVAATLGVTAADVCRVKQVHGRGVRLVARATKTWDVEPADAIVSTDPRRAIAVQVADCVPILLADRRGRAVAAVHAGWRGTCAGIAGAAVEALGELGVPASDLVAALGPSIGPCCYQVDGPVHQTFLGMTPDAVGWFIEDGLDRWKLDLWQANVDQLESAGVAADAIHAPRLCTAEHLDICFSYRKEGSGAGRLMAAIRLGEPART